MSSSINIRISFDSAAKPIAFQLSADATVDDVYMGLSVHLEKPLCEAHSYELTCKKSETDIDPSMGLQKITDVAKPLKARGRTYAFLASEIHHVQLCLVVENDSDSDASTELSSDSDVSSASSELSSDSDSTYETESSCSSSVEDGPANPERTTARIYLNHEHGDYYDEIQMRREDDQIQVTYSYDRRSNTDAYCRTNTFYGSVDEVVAYAGRMLRLLAIDRKPYAEIEVDIPFYPAISVVSADLLKKPRRVMILAALREFLQEGIESV